MKDLLPKMVSIIGILEEYWKIMVQAMGGRQRSLDFQNDSWLLHKGHFALCVGNIPCAFFSIFT